MIDPCIRRIRALPPSHSLLAGLIAALSGVSAANASPPQAARNAFGQGVLAPARIVQPAGSPGQAALSMASVSSCADDGPGTLRAAVATHAAMIDLTGLACSKITLTTGAIRVDAEVPSITISGPTSHLLTIDANHDSRILLHYGNGTLTLDHLRLINGSISPDIQYNGAARYGGSVFSSGSVVLQHASISNCLVAIGNAAVTVGGAVYAHGDLTLNDSVLSGNVAQGLSVMGGGAFFNGKLDMYRSAIRDNVAIATAGTAVAGGAYAGGTAQLYASTISGKQAATKAAWW